MVDLLIFDEFLSAIFWWKGGASFAWFLPSISTKTQLFIQMFFSLVSVLSCQKRWVHFLQRSFPTAFIIGQIGFHRIPTPSPKIRLELGVELRTRVGIDIAEIRCGEEQLQVVVLAGFLFKKKLQAYKLQYFVLKKIAKKKMMLLVWHCCVLNPKRKLQQTPSQWRMLKRLWPWLKKNWEMSWILLNWTKLGKQFQTDIFWHVDSRFEEMF